MTSGNTGIGTNSLQTESQICTDWFLITTIYYEDGSTEVFEDYLGRTCVDGGCLPNEWCVPQPEDPVVAEVESLQIFRTTIIRPIV